MRVESLERTFGKLSTKLYQIRCGKLVPRGVHARTLEGSEVALTHFAFVEGTQRIQHFRSGAVGAAALELAAALPEPAIAVTDKRPCRHRIAPRSHWELEGCGTSLVRYGSCNRLVQAGNKGPAGNLED
mmetsp:Transcript_36206/g.66885  ORF Transcript_36206/g.66885 Transcript_36206/m.66885 type:complete len:129 (-) Transcript_36206:615-1001(-)